VYRTIILTGIPRSGTSLACNLLNKYENTIALLEPMKVFESDPMKGNLAACKDIVDFVFKSRTDILYKSKITTGQINGKIGDNTFEQKTDATNTLRKAIVKNGELTIEQDVEKDFNLILKHPAFFTVLLDDIQNFFECYAMIRNPLSMLASWNTIDVPINRGRIPAAERYDESLSNMLDSIPDRIDRQIYILNWFFKKYKDCLDNLHIIKYENLIEDNGLSLSELSYNHKIKSGHSIQKLQSKNINHQYQDVNVTLLYNKLISDRFGAYLEFYTISEIDEVYEQMNAL